MTAAKDKSEAPTIPPSSSIELDSPDMRQFISRLMLGYEQAHRSRDDFFDRLLERFERMENAVARGLEMQLKLAEEREELISRRHRRELEAEAEKTRQASIAALHRDLRTMLVLGGKKWMGVPLTGNDSHGLQDLLETMSMEQLDTVMSTGTLQLTPAQRHLLASTLGSLAQAERAEQQVDEPKAAE